MREAVSRFRASTRREDEMTSTFDYKQWLQWGGALAFIVLGALSAAQSRGDPLAETYVLALICVGALGLATGVAATARGEPTAAEQIRAAADNRREFEQKVDAALAQVLNLVHDHLADGAKYSEALVGANRRLARDRSYDTIHQIVLKLIEDNRAMQVKVNGLSEKLEFARGQITRLQSNLVRAQEIGNRDPLTSLGNRRFFDAALAEEAEKARVDGADLCVALADIDHFKKINDSFGHVAGDMTLKLFAELLAGSVGPRAKVARYGGEEFAFLFPDTPLAKAVATIDQIQRQLESKRWVVAASGDRIGAITASFGVAQLKVDESADDLIRRVDAKLYEAKAAGRNRVLVDPERENPRGVEG
jgi:diguanylate cyclase